MPLYDIKDRPPFLYNGRPELAHQDGPLIPNDCPTVTGDPGQFVFATEWLSHAALYGLMPFTPLAIGVLPIREKLIPYALVSFPNKNAESFEATFSHNTYIRTLPSDTFKGVLHEEPIGEKTARPSEWVTTEPVSHTELTVLNNEEIAATGAQIFTGHPSIIWGMRFDSLRMGNLIRSGQITWENMHPRYDNVPEARSLEMMHLLGLRGPQHPNTAKIFEKARTHAKHHRWSPS